MTHTDLRADPVLASAQSAAEAALRELPEALVMVFDEQLRFLLSAGQVLERLADPGVCAEGQSLARAFPAELWPALQPLFASALEGETRSHELWTSGRRHCLMVLVGPLRHEEPGAGAAARPPGGVAVLLDVTARRRSASLQSGQGAGFEHVFERAPVGTGLLDLDGRWLLVNRALCEITGYTAEELLGTRMEGIVHPDDAGRDAAQMKQLLAGEIRAYHAEKRYFDAAGETVSVILSMSLVRDRGGAPLHLIAQLQDISDRKRLEDDLRALADHDPVTGVRSRRLFEHDLKLQVARSQRYGEAAGLLVIGLDSFAHVQELHGAGIAERMLEAVARALTRRLRQTDLLGRLDEGRFAVLLPHIDEDGLAVAADSVMRVIPAASVEVGADVLHPTASIGTQIIDDRTASAEQALTAADRAMRDARSSRIAR